MLARLSFFVTVLVVSTSVFAAEKPMCINVGTRSEGWHVPGKSIIYDQCAGLEAECAGQGTRSEAWVKVRKNILGLLKYAKCSEISEVPVCVGIERRSEGWKLPDGRIKYANCAGKTSECAGVGTRSEGWVVVEKQTEGIIQYALCSK